jgi:hypothetical protein
MNRHRGTYYSTLRHTYTGTHKETHSNGDTQSQTETHRDMGRDKETEIHSRDSQTHINTERGIVQRHRESEADMERQDRRHTHAQTTQRDKYANRVKCSQRQVNTD